MTTEPTYTIRSVSSRPSRQDRRQHICKLMRKLNLLFLLPQEASRKSRQCHHGSMMLKRRFMPEITVHMLKSNHNRRMW